MTSSNWATPDAADPSKTIGQAGLLSFDFYTSQVRTCHFKFHTSPLVYHCRHACVSSDLILNAVLCKWTEEVAATLGPQQYCHSVHNRGFQSHTIF